MATQVMKYIDSVDGDAHQSAVDIIGELESEVKENKFLLEHGTAALLKAKDERITVLEHWLQHAITIIEAAEERPKEIAVDWKAFLKKALEQALKGE